MKRFKKIFFIVVILMVSSSYSKQQEIEYNENNIADFPIQWIEFLTYSYKDFVKTNFNTSCFVVELIKAEGKYYVVYSPKSDIKIVGDNISLTQGGNNKCGKGVSYEFSKLGKFNRRIYHR